MLCVNYISIKLEEIINKNKKDYSRTGTGGKGSGHNLYKNDIGTSLVAQWLRIGLEMQGTLLHSLVGELRSDMLRSN